ncbi:MAG TPA: carboxylating nicotinate-nucleotide diphosphorylase [Bacteroidales bacterium]|nr:carboxylating nicotinate-nucleotide diphosphorylase [Bacteroidales bacterium]HSA43500.1 carboxylating nicotinate-nucleotide diphosphorylase [Bacteroidales bacterium]
MTQHELILAAIREDLGDGDHTSLATIPADCRGKMKLLVKQAGVIAGVEVAVEVFRLVDASIRTEILIADGSAVMPGDVVFLVEGPVIRLLQAERLVLNYMQRMSGIATHTRQFVDALDGLPARVLDTRKTTPNMRLLEKEAVRLGGGANHRHGLYDMILIKDNHVDFAGGIAAAVARVHEYLRRKGINLKIEIEARNMQEVEEIMACGGVHRIMLDNFSLPALKEAVDRIAGRFETEASGGISLSNVRDVARCGVDFISVGALTHQIHSLDLSLKAIT